MTGKGENGKIRSRSNSPPLAKPPVDSGALSPSAENCNVYVAGIPRSATEETIKGKFGQFGEIKKVSIVRDHQTGNSRGFCYVVFTKSEEAQAAI